MQAVGFIGESILWINIDAIHQVLRTSILRFIIFDGAGLLLLMFAFILTGWFNQRAVRAG
jgi:hypothetical protein